MSMSSIGGLLSISGAVQAYAVSPPAGPSAVAPATPAASSDVSASISREGDLLSRMQQLAQKDPSKFGSIMTEASSELQTVAASETGDKAQALRNLANKFAQAASSGNASPLHQTMARSAGHGRHRHGGGASSMTTPGATLSDKAQAELSQVSDQVDQALGLSTAPLGPWLPR